MDTYKVTVSTPALDDEAQYLVQCHSAMHAVQIVATYHARSAQNDANVVTTLTVNLATASNLAPENAHRYTWLDLYGTEHAPAHV